MKKPAACCIVRMEFFKSNKKIFCYGSGLPTAISHLCQGCPWGGLLAGLGPVAVAAVLCCREGVIRLAFSIVGAIELFRIVGAVAADPLVADC